MLSLNIDSIVFLLVNAILMLWLPRRWVPLPLLLGACYMTFGQVILVGPFHFTIIRVFIAIGLARVMLRGERLEGGMNRLDRLMLIWSIWALMSSAFHNDPFSALIYRLGLTYNACGIYFLIRVLCRSLDDVRHLCIMMAILLIPVAAEMLYEYVTLHNLFADLGGVLEISEIREGRIRAAGPFAHPILAGTIGAVSFPLMTGLWNQHRKIAITGIIACLTMIFSSSSSGPVLSVLVAISALFMWRYRRYTNFILWLLLIAYIALDLVMNAPAYYIISHVGVVGGSTAWYRAYLIESAIAHLPEWWLAGTDVTRHWTPYGVGWSSQHADITNQYISMGVVGGLALMLLFIAILFRGFSLIGKTLREAKELPLESQFIIWTLGASLFTHAVAFLSISYFDQSVVFFYLTLAAISSITSVEVVSRFRMQFDKPDCTFDAANWY